MSIIWDVFHSNEHLQHKLLLFELANTGFMKQAGFRTKALNTSAKAVSLDLANISNTKKKTKYALAFISDMD